MRWKCVERFIVLGNELLKYSFDSTMENNTGEEAG